jgi:hypothetical protein
MNDKYPKISPHTKAMKSYNKLRYYKWRKPYEVKPEKMPVATHTNKYPQIFIEVTRN